jgi:hypothetical protein
MAALDTTARCLLAFYGKDGQESNELPLSAIVSASRSIATACYTLRGVGHLSAQYPELAARTHVELVECVHQCLERAWVWKDPTFAKTRRHRALWMHPEIEPRVVFERDAIVGRW